MLCLWLAVVFGAWGRTVPDVNDPLGFFTSVADKLLRSTFPFGVTNIPVCSNGVCVYTPAVQRLLQLSANIYDACNTNVFPVVFRPLFANDAASNLFIIGYVQVTNVSGVSDPQLSPPYDMTQLSGAVGRPIVNGSGPVNVYGVPWIIGAKKGLPGFNQFYQINSAQVTRKLQVSRNTIDPAVAIYATNQMYVMSISNSLGISFWNSYASNYPHPVTVFASDTIYLTLTNDAHGGSFSWSGYTNFIAGGPNGLVISSWPGSQWSGIPPNAVPNAAAFIANNWSFSFLNPSVYRFNTASFDPIGLPTSSVFETTTPPLPPLPQFGLTTTNYLQAFILNGSNVIDYVQLRSPNGSGSISQTLADPDFPSLNAIYYQWSTNLYQNGPVAPTWGVVNQLLVSRDYAKAPAAGGQWSATPIPGLGGDTTPPAESAYFEAFFFSPVSYKGVQIYNYQVAMQAPYTPSRTVFSAYLLQADDPLVHYLASDLNSQLGSAASWNGKQTYKNGVWNQISDPVNQPLPSPPATPIGGRYQPWGQYNQMKAQGNIDTNGYNLAYRDPLVWWPDNWNFPTNLLPSLAGLGQVHRGTPWQTVNLKATNILLSLRNIGSSTQNVGSNTWAAWTGDLLQDSFSGQYLDAALMAPVNDWRLAGLLMSVLNSNSPAQLFSVNDRSAADWQNILSDMIAYSNSAPVVFPTVPLQFDTYVLSSNSPQASTIANAIVQARAGTNFYSIGGILVLPALSQNSPFLNLGGTGFGQQQMNYGIADWEYEAIPAQLLPRLRPDSIGTLTPTNGGWSLGFSGADGYTYAVQTSTNLTDWNSLSTNYPVQGSFTVPVNFGSGVTNQFFRSVLLP